MKAVNYNDLLLADAEPVDEPETRHLYTTAKEATHEILWNHAGMDVANLVNTHRKLDQVHAKWDKNANDGTVKNYGFKYSFELVGYHMGNNKTSESAHAAMKGSVLRPQMTKDGKQQAFGAEQNKAVKDREPLVRVILTDTVSNKIASVGYVKFKIVDKETPNKNEVVLAASFPFNDGYTVDCTETAIKHSLTWYQVEEQIIAQLEKQGISKADFHDNFKLDGGATDATQYDGVVVDSKRSTKTGVVQQTTWDPEDEKTEVLTWTVKNNNAYQIFKNNESITVNVRYSKEVGAASGIYQYVYVTFTWKPAPRNVKPAGTIANADKISNYWYAKNSKDAKTGYSDIHANVEPVGQPDADDEFKSDILNTFLGNDVTVSGVDAVYKAFLDAKLTKTFTFVNPQGTTLTPVVGNSGQKYDVTVSPDGKTLYANIVGASVTKKAIVKLNGALLEYQKEDWAKDILNYADHNELADKQTFTAKIQINAANCAYVPFELADNTFFAKFLRPVTVTDPKETNFLDAETGGSIAKLKLTFIDWRDHNFDDVTVTKNHNYYEYYDIRKITCLDTKIMTDMNASTGDFSKLLSEVTTRLKFSYTATTAAEIQNKNFGTLNYANNNTTVGDFQIKVPFDVEYEWGTIRVYVICKIAGTTAN